jgi:dTDP-4-amino-4,6-dideoxygalactose transaminase
MALCHTDPILESPAIQRLRQFVRERRLQWARSTPDFERFEHELHEQIQAIECEFLAEELIPHGIYYPVPLHLQKAFAMSGGRKGDFPVTEKATEEVLSLPMHTELTDEQLAAITGAVKEFYGKN